jgi:general stress protein 26
MARAVEKNADIAVSTEKKLDELYELIDGIDTALLTTRQIDGSLVSRPMAVQERRAGVDLWFMTSAETHKAGELEAQPDVNVAFYKERTREWVSVSGTARLNRDRERIRKVYQKDWKAWLGDEGGDRDGGPNDPRILLIEIDAHAVTYMKSDVSRPVALFKIAKAMVTGERVELGEVRHIDGRELDQRP